MPHTTEVNLSGRHLLIRTDAGPLIGSGHVMRCLALAQGWQESGGAVTLNTANSLPPAFDARLKAAGLEICHSSAKLGSAEDAQHAITLMRELAAAWIVVDGYHLDVDYQRAIKDAGLRLMWVDDNGHAEHYYADIVLNQNIHADEGLYARREPYTRLLLGTQYAMLRREFWKWRGWQRHVPEVAHKVLITLGGSDPDNVTLRVIWALEQIEMQGLDVKVVIGPTNPHGEILSEGIAGSKHDIKLLTDVEDMPSLMAWADIAVSAGGSTCWELAFMGLPSIVIAVAQNQISIARDADAAGSAVSLGWHTDVSTNQIGELLSSLAYNSEQRRSLSEKGRGLVDALGADRVVSAIRTLCLRLRPIREEDCQLIFAWANDPVVRAASFSPTPILWETHVTWFRRQLQDERCLFLVAETEEGIPVGQVRFVMEDNEATISISLAQAFRGKGLGSRLIALASKQMLCTRTITTIHAYIKQDNMVSQRAFASAGYTLGMSSIVDGQPAIHMTFGGL